MTRNNERLLSQLPVDTIPARSRASGACTSARVDLHVVGALAGGGDPSEDRIMRLAEVRDGITALGLSRPWGFTGDQLIATLGYIDLRWGPVHPPFPLDLDLPDPFLLVRHTGHVPECSIEGFRTLEDLELEIVGGAGLMNRFVTHCVAFVAGKAAPFEILYRDALGAEVEFDKDRQLDGEVVEPQHPARRVVWK